MSSNRKISIWALVAMICLSLTGCGGATTYSTTPSQPGHTSTGHPTGMWSTLPYTMPINPVHAALLHTGKVLIVSGSGNCPPTQAGCPQGPQYPQGAALMDLSANKITAIPTSWDTFCNGMSIMLWAML
jgi:hypothetical protein